MHGMYLFTETLVHACYKFKSKYFDSPKHTTRTCSNCGHVNNKIPLSVRELVCDNCGLKINRDKNAAINCYEFLLDKEIS